MTWRAKFISSSGAPKRWASAAANAATSKAAAASGLWARWAFVTPPDDIYKKDRFPAGERRPPQELIWALRGWHNRLGIPTVAIQDKDTFAVGLLPITTITVTDQVVEAYYTYGDAVMELVTNFPRGRLYFNIFIKLKNNSYYVVRII